MKPDPSELAFVDLGQQQDRIRDALRRRIDAVRAHRQFIMGPEVPEFEQRLGSFVGAKEERDGIRGRLADGGVPTAVYDPIPLHLQPAFAHLAHKEGDFHVAEAASKRVLSLPMHAYVTSTQQERVASALAGALSLAGR